MLKDNPLSTALIYLALVALHGCQSALAGDLERRHQFCWANGSYDQTVYFAEVADREDRQQSFTDMIELFGISHSGIRCGFFVGQQYETERSQIFEKWKAQKLETVNTTFLSDLDY